MIANVPHCWPILSRVFKLGSFKNTSANGVNSGDRYKLSSTSAMASSSRRRYDEHGYIRSESEERIANAGTGPGFTSAPAPTQGCGPLESDVELGDVNRHEPYIGTAITAGGKEQNPYSKDRGVIVKTTSMNQTYSDEKL